MDDTNAASAPSARPFPSFWWSIIWIILYFAGQLLISMLAYGVAAARDPDLVKAFLDPRTKTDPNFIMPYIAVPTLWALVISGLLFFFGIWLYLRKDSRLTQIGLMQWSRLPFLHTLGLGAALIGGATVFNIGFGEVLTYFFGPGFEPQDAVLKLLSGIDPTPLNITLRFAAVALIAPLAEELLFRGLLQKSLMNKMGPTAAIWLAALLFAGAHMQLYATPMLMVLGAAFGYLYYKTGSLRTNIALHMINNAAALLMLPSS
jgi:membrane protease YdiL (CAAX protease family)